MRVMIFRLALTVTLMTMAASVSAQVLSDEGTLIRLDPPSRVVTLEDGRMYRAVAGTSFLVESQSETFERLRPGARIVVIGGEPVVYRQGRYIALPAVPPSVGLAVAPQSDAVLSSAATPPAPSHTVSAGYRVGPPPASLSMPATSMPSTAWRPAGTLQHPSRLFPSTQNSP